MSEPTLIVGHAGVTFVGPDGSSRTIDPATFGDEPGYHLLFAQVLLLDHVARGNAELAASIAKLADALTAAISRPARDPAAIADEMLSRAQATVASVLRGAGLTPPQPS